MFDDTNEALAKMFAYGCKVNTAPVTATEEQQIISELESQINALRQELHETKAEFARFVVDANEKNFLSGWNTDDQPITYH